MGNCSVGSSVGIYESRRFNTKRCELHCRCIGLDINGDGVKELTNGVGDSSNALKIASLKHEKVMVGMSQTFSEYFESIISMSDQEATWQKKDLKHPRQSFKILRI